MGVATFPDDGRDPNELVHRADLAVYRAKLQGRNRVLERGRRRAARRASARPGSSRCRPRSPGAVETVGAGASRADAAACRPARSARAAACSTLSRRLGVLVAAVAAAGIAGGVVGHRPRRLDRRARHDRRHGAGRRRQVLALELEDGSISVGAVGAITAARCSTSARRWRWRVVSALVDWSARRHAASPRALQRRHAQPRRRSPRPACSGRRLARARQAARRRHRRSSRRSRTTSVNMGLLSVALGIEGRQGSLSVWRERFAWLLPHYAAFGFVAGVIAIAYERRRRLGARGGRPAAAADAQDAGGLPRARGAEHQAAPRGGRDDPHAERLAGAGQPPPARALDGRDGEPLGNRGRPRLLYRRPLAPRAAPRAGDRSRARPLAGRARPARPRGALPRHRQAGDPRRDPDEARTASTPKSGG